ncbi:MAG: CBS domain-containing protein [Pirellulales bacterium]
MSSESRPLNVVVVSQDVTLLHEISWVLEAVGYRVQTTNDFEADAHWRRYSMPDFLIVDGRGVNDPTAALFNHESENPLYRIVLYDPDKSTDFSAWYAAGAHDALRTPVSRGELLARVRTGARFLEFERRLLVHSSRSNIPGLYSRRGLLRKLKKLAAEDEAGGAQHTLIVTAIDWYAGIRRKSGETASRSLSNTASRAVKRAVGDSAVAAYLGEGKFAILLVGQGIPAAKAAAEALAKDFGSRESHHESLPRPTLTSAIVPWTSGSNIDRFLTDALETLDVAIHSGGDCVIMHGEFNQELAAWQEEMSTGNPFANVVAQDIMEPFPALLEKDTDQSELAEALRKAGIPVRPYVDRDGRLIGVVDDEAAAAETRAGQPAAAPTLSKPETIACDASFPEIYEAFSSRGCATLVVTAGDHPLGYLTCDGFLSMIDPIHSESFIGTKHSPDDPAFLVVPSLVGEAISA